MGEAGGCCERRLEYVYGEEGVQNRGSLESRGPQNQLNCWLLSSHLLPMNEGVFSWRCQGWEGLPLPSTHHVTLNKSFPCPGSQFPQLVVLHILETLAFGGVLSECLSRKDLLHVRIPSLPTHPEVVRHLEVPLRKVCRSPRWC